MTAGARFDHETGRPTSTRSFSGHRSSTVVDTEKSFSNVSPQGAITFHLQPDAITYFSVTGGFKAGGFNPASPRDRGLRGRAHVELRGGFKSAWAGRRVIANVSASRSTGPIPAAQSPEPEVLGQLHLERRRRAQQRCRVRVELPRATAPTCSRPSATRTRASTRERPRTCRVVMDVSGKKIRTRPTTPRRSARSCRTLTPDQDHGRAEAVFYGAFQHNDANGGAGGIADEPALRRAR